MPPFQFHALMAVLLDIPARVLYSRGHGVGLAPAKATGQIVQVLFDTDAIWLPRTEADAKKFLQQQQKRAAVQEAEFVRSPWQSPDGFPPGKVVVPIVNHNIPTHYYEMLEIMGCNHRRTRVGGGLAPHVVGPMLAKTKLDKRTKIAIYLVLVERLQPRFAARRYRLNAASLKVAACRVKKLCQDGESTC